MLRRFLPRADLAPQRLLFSLGEITQTTCIHILGSGFGAFCEQLAHHGFTSDLLKVLTTGEEAVFVTAAVLLGGTAIRMARHDKSKAKEAAERFDTLHKLLKRGAQDEADALAILKKIVADELTVLARLDTADKQDIALLFRAEVRALVSDYDANNTALLERLDLLIADHRAELRAILALQADVGELKTDIIGIKKEQRRSLKRWPAERLLAGWRGFGAHWGSLLTLTGRARPCEAAELTNELRSLFIEGGRRFAAEREPADERRRTHELSAIELSESMIMPRQAYERIITEWWNCDPHTVVLPLDSEGQPDGICLSAPIKPATYAKIRSGEMKTQECTTADLEVPSPYLLTEVAMMHPWPEQVACFRTTRWRLVRALICQWEYLSNCAGLFDTVPLHIITYGGMNLYKSALSKLGFRWLNRKMRDTPYELFELRLSWREIENLNRSRATAIGLWQWHQAELRGDKCPIRWRGPWTLSSRST